MSTAGRRDSFYFRAKGLEYRSRAAFKLLELQERFGVIGNGPVLEFGSSPGGWTQVALSFNVGSILSIDRVSMEPVENVTFLKADLLDPSVEVKIRDWLSSNNLGGFSSVLSDAMVKTSGNHSLDHSRSYEICRRVLDLSLMFLTEGGSVAAKMFQGDLTADLFRKYSGYFGFSKMTSVSATREGSSEIYLIFKRFAGKRVR